MRSLHRHAGMAAAVAAVAGAAVAFATVGTSGTHGAATSQGYLTPPAITENTPAQGCVSAEQHAMEVVQSSLGRGRLLFVGASYSIGLGATNPADHFPNRLAGLLHLPFRVDASSGTGFLNPGSHDQGTFAERIAKDKTDPPPRLVVIQGGRDDAGRNLSREYTAVYQTITLAQHRFDHAQVVLLGPIPALLPVNKNVLTVRDDIRRAAAAAHAGFIDPIAEGWITLGNEHEFIGRVQGHPNNAGYAYITNRLLAELPNALSQSQLPLSRPTRPGNGRDATSISSISTPSASSSPADKAAPVCGIRTRGGAEGGTHAHGGAGRGRTGQGGTGQGAAGSPQPLVQPSLLGYSAAPPDPSDPNAQP